MMDQGGADGPEGQGGIRGLTDWGGEGGSEDRGRTGERRSPAESEGSRVKAQQLILKSEDQAEARGTREPGGA